MFTIDDAVLDAGAHSIWWTVPADSPVITCLTVEARQDRGPGELYLVPVLRPLTCGRAGPATADKVVTTLREMLHREGTAARPRQGGRWRDHGVVINRANDKNLRGGLSSKIHPGGGPGCRPLARIITLGQHGDCPQLIPLMDQLRLPPG